MKKYLKRVGCIALASVMIIGALAGCGQGKGNSGGTNNDNAANNENTAVIMGTAMRCLREKK